MIATEALAILEMGALRKCSVTYDKLGPSQGDPGGQTIITRACKSYTHKWGQILSQDESLCDCPAKRHNEIVREAVDTLKKAITP